MVQKAVDHHLVKLSSGLTMHYACAKPKVSNGKFVVFVHGFPELWISWIDQMPAVANLGFTAIAPDMRGYGRTDAPGEVDAYHMKYLTSDLCELLDHLGAEKAVFVGHDWGGVVVWSFVFHFEERCLGVASLNTPLAMWDRIRDMWEGAGCNGPMEFLQGVPSENCGQIDYQVYFNIRQVPEKELEADIPRTIYAFFRSHNTVKSGMRTGRVRKDNNRGVLFYAEKGLQRDPIWTQEEMDLYISEFSRNGFFGPLGWYRNIDANVEWDRQSGCVPGKKVIQVPCLMVTAEYDAVLTPEESAGMEQHFRDLSRGHVKCGHWVQREQPEQVNEIICGWLRKSILKSSSSL